MGKLHLNPHSQPMFYMLTQPSTKTIHKNTWSHKNVKLAIWLWTRGSILCDTGGPSCADKSPLQGAHISTHLHLHLFYKVSFENKQEHRQKSRDILCNVPGNWFLFVAERKDRNGCYTIVLRNNFC